MAATLKLIAYGKVLDSDDKKVTEYNLKDGDFIVAMVQKARPPPKKKEEKKDEEPAASTQPAATASTAAPETAATASATAPTQPPA